MFDRTPEKTPLEMGAEIVEQTDRLFGSFEEMRIAPLQSALVETFGSLLDRSIAQHGVNPSKIRDEFVNLKRAWQAGLMEMKPELLEFRDMSDWLDCASAVNARNEILDHLDSCFASCENRLWQLAISMIGGRVLSFGLEGSEAMDAE